jgi:hypothetical protein
MYTPAQTTFTSPEDLLTFVQQELRQVASALQELQVQHVQFAELHKEPVRPREGMSVFADGTNWNPGDGRGIYAYDSGEWVRMSNLPIVVASPSATALHELVDVGWEMTPAGGTAEQPAVLTYTNGALRIKAVLTWGTSGGEDGNVTRAVYSWSQDSGTTYTALGTETITYDSDSNVVSVTWS